MPFEVDGSLAAGTTVNLTRVGTPTLLATTVTRADAPKLLISWRTAGWHISFDALEQFLAGEPNGRIVGADAIKFGWQRLNAE